MAEKPLIETPYVHVRGVILKGVPLPDGAYVVVEFRTTRFKEAPETYRPHNVERQKLTVKNKVAKFPLDKALTPLVEPFLGEYSLVIILYHSDTNGAIGKPIAHVELPYKDHKAPAGEVRMKTVEMKYYERPAFNPNNVQITLQMAFEGKLESVRSTRDVLKEICQKLTIRRDYIGSPLTEEEHQCISKRPELRLPHDPEIDYEIENIGASGITEASATDTIKIKCIEVPDAEKPEPERSREEEEALWSDKGTARPESEKPLNFGTAGRQFKVDVEKKSYAVLKNKGMELLCCKIDIVRPHDATSEFGVSCDRFDVWPGESVKVTFRLKMTMTATEKFEAIFYMRYKCRTEIRAQKLTVNAISALSPRIKYTDIIEDGDKRKVLGRGGQRAVYKATYRGLDVAVKEIDISQECTIESDPELLSGLRHPAIALMIGYAKRASKIFIVSEYAEHGSLRNFIGDGHLKHGFAFLVKVLLDVSSGMAFLHESGIIHRDLKPENILIFSTAVEKTCAPIAKLTDFGISRTINAESGSPSTTTKIGTELYIAPEMRESAEYSFPVDVYSFGRVMWETITGKSIITCARPKQLDEKDLPDGFWRDLFVRTQQKDPKARPEFKYIHAGIMEFFMRLFP